MNSDLMDLLPGTGELRLRETQAGYIIRSAAGLLPGAHGCEVEVDVRRREMRVAGRNPQGGRRDERILRFEEIDGAEIMRCGLTSCLLVRLRGDGGAFPVAFGRRVVLDHVRTRLTADVRPLAQRVSSYRLGAGTCAAGRRLKATARPDLS